MFDYMKGQLMIANSTFIIIDNQGIGYRILIPTNAFGKLPSIGENIHVYISFVIREFSHTLYGFLSIQERDLFEILMGVTGIGPKLALSIIGHLLLTDFQQAIIKADLTLICKVPGIGRKTAERLVIELRDKLKEFVPTLTPPLGIMIPKNLQEQKIQDAMSALVNLGYNQGVAQKALKKTLLDCSTDVDLPSLITASLKNI